MDFFLNHKPGNPRNSEGAFVRLANGSFLLVYSRYNGDSWGDDCSADLASRISCDGGKTWSDEKLLLKNPALNVMSVSLLRLHDGRIAMVYLLKRMIDNGCIACTPQIMFSSDEAESWSQPRPVADIPAYLVVNNDRLIQLKNGRLLLPAAYHPYNIGKHISSCAFVRMYLSDDNGETWRESRQNIYPPNWLESSGFQEPCAVEHPDGSLTAYFRTGAGSQYKSFSCDQGETWTEAIPATEFPSPKSPMSVKYHPETGELFAVWNDHSPLRSVAYEDGSWGRTPLVIARSRDNGRTWCGHTVLEDAPDHGFAYIAMLFEGNSLLLEYCCGGDGGMLQDSKVRVFDLAAMNH